MDAICGQALSRRRSSCDVEHEEHCRDIDGGAYDWEPVVSDSGGRLPTGAVRVINRLAKLAAHSDGVYKLVPKHVFVRRMQEAPSVARVRG